MPSVRPSELSVDYPFTPKSTSYLQPGQFWGIQLNNGSYACGKVLQLCVVAGRTDRRQFLAGLMDWRGETLPTHDSISGSKLLAHGGAHIKTIVHTGERILGFRALDLDGIEIPRTLDQGPGSKLCRVRRGFDRLGIATGEERLSLPVFSTWGYNVIRLLANKHLGGGGLTIGCD